MTFLRKPGSLVVVWIKSLATAAQCSFCSGSRSCGMNFATMHSMPRSHVKIPDTAVLGIPRPASSSGTVSHWSLLIAAHTCSTFSGVLLVAGLPDRGSLSTDSWPSLKHLCHSYLHCTLAISSKAFWIIWIVSMEECSSLMQNLIQIHCSTHSVILNVMATQYTCPLNGVYHPLTSTVKSPLFRHVHSSPLSLASRLHWCWANCSLYINNGWAFSGQALVYSVIFPEKQREYISLQLNYLKMLFLKIRRREYLFFFFVLSEIPLNWKLTHRAALF